jgi:hypothetical protein
MKSITTPEELWCSRSLPLPANAPISTGSRRVTLRSVPVSHTCLNEEVGRGKWIRTTDLVVPNLNSRFLHNR